MRKNISFFLIANVIFLVLVCSSSSQILVEGANDVWDTQLFYTSSPDISPRITVEYASRLIDKEIIYPGDLLLIAKSIPPRIVVEYATFVSQIQTKVPPCKGDFDGDGDVDGFDLYGYTEKFEELPLIIFCTSIGRTMCLE